MTNHERLQMIKHHPSNGVLDKDGSDKVGDLPLILQSGSFFLHLDPH